MTARLKARLAAARAPGGRGAPRSDPSASRAGDRAGDAIVALAEPAEDAERPDYKEVGGSLWREWNSAVLRATVAAIPTNPGDADDSQRIDVAYIGLRAFEPRDEIEAMIGAQALALHRGAMECFARALTPGQPIDVASKLRRDGANLARGMTDMLSALDARRGKTQVVRVERVVVNSGGQAVVGGVAVAPAPRGEGG